MPLSLCEGAPRGAGSGPAAIGGGSVRRAQRLRVWAVLWRRARCGGWAKARRCMGFRYGGRGAAGPGDAGGPSAGQAPLGLSFQSKNKD